MAHSAQMKFFEIAIEFFPREFSERVLDIGSHDINGGPHRLLDCLEYVGVDLGPGENVTLVSRGEDVDLPSNYFDVAMASECFEHNPAWRETVANMWRMLRPGGLLIFSCATTGRPEHGTSRSDGGVDAPLAVISGQEYYANVEKADAEQVARAVCPEQWFVTINPRFQDLYFAAIKPSATARQTRTFRSFKRAVRAQVKWRWAKGPALRRLFLRAGGMRALLLFDVLHRAVDRVYVRILK